VLEQQCRQNATILEADIMHK